jgi:hypothetical protein
MAAVATVPAVVVMCVITGVPRVVVERTVGVHIGGRMAGRTYITRRAAVGRCVNAIVVRWIVGHSDLPLEK